MKDKDARGALPYPFGLAAAKPRYEPTTGRIMAPKTAKPRSGANRRGSLNDPPSRLVNHEIEFE